MSDVSSEIKSGHLYVVATPIGNLSDLSPRALKILDGVDRIYAEDTRNTGAMLAHFGMKKRLVAFHDHNEDEIAVAALDELRQGRALALVSDAGTPLISDPGFALVRAARNAQLPVIAVPGPCAAMAALSIAGLPTDRFVFAGFLPSKAQARKQVLSELAHETRTLIFYESSHRIADSLQALSEAFGAQRRICLARELTKLYEESITAPIADVLGWLAADDNRQRGEFVLVVEGAIGSHADADVENLLRILLGELPASRAARVAAQISGKPRKEIYALALTLSGRKDIQE
ncbi:MAG: 16S rRNA (cytidine(1402)-2'-O)-methyltransferase [Pseudomonadota bacterium]